MASYPSSMTDSEWEILETLLPTKPDTLRGRPQEHSRLDIIDGILYILRTGGAWRATWRGSQPVKKAPTAAIIDSQSVRTASQPGVRGYDAGKKVTGRKRHGSILKRDMPMSVA